MILETLAILEAVVIGIETAIICFERWQLSRCVKLMNESAEILKRFNEIKTPAPQVAPIPPFHELNSLIVRRQQGHPDFLIGNN